MILSNSIMKIVPTSICSVPFALYMWKPHNIFKALVGTTNTAILKVLSMYTQMEGYLRKYPYQVPYKVPIKYTDYVLYTHQWAKRPQRHIVLIIVVNPEHLSKCTAKIQEEISDNFMFIRIKNAIR